MLVFNAKMISSVAKGVAVWAILVGASAPAPAIAGDPVPGIDVSLEQIPGGTLRTKTDSTGSFVFGRLAPGSYVLRLGPVSAPPGGVKPGTPVVMGENHSSSRKNIKPTSVQDGIENHVMDIEVNPAVVLPGRDPGITITIGNRGGRISGIVTKGASGPPR